MQLASLIFYSSLSELATFCSFHMRDHVMVVTHEQILLKNCIIQQVFGSIAIAICMQACRNTWLANQELPSLFHAI